MNATAATATVKAVHGFLIVSHCQRARAASHCGSFAEHAALLRTSQAHYGPCFWPRRWGLVLHIAGGVVALAVGLVQAVRTASRIALPPCIAPSASCMWASSPSRALLGSFWR